MESTFFSKDYTFLPAMAEYIRSAVRPFILGGGDKSVTGVSDSGDATFALDDAAEKAVSDFITTHALPVAVYSEDAGFVSRHPEPKLALVIDPVDGTRPAAAGLEMSCVSIAAAPFHSREEITMKSVEAGAIMEIKGNALFVAEKGRGAGIIQGGKVSSPKPALPDNPDGMFWTFEVAGRPVQRVIRHLGPLIDRTSIKGTAFIFSSTTFSLMRLLTGQFHAHVDIGARIFMDEPDSESEFRKAGFGRVVSLFPYDIAAAVLILKEAGLPITDAWGRSQDDVRLTDSSEANLQSCVAATSAELHEKLINYINKSFSETE